MTHLNRRTFARRTFAGTVLGVAVGSRNLTAASALADTTLDDTLRNGIASRKIPAVAGMVSIRNKITWQGAFGVRDSSGVPVTIDSIFSIASMTKAITTAAALQLVEQNKVKLDEPVGRYLPPLSGLDVLEGFDAGGKPQLRPARTPITLRHLLTHTSGLCYDIWDEQMFRYVSKGKTLPPAGPLMFEPGARWQYGQGLDWAGKLVEALSGMSLEQYLQTKIFAPLGMADTSYIVKPEKFDRLVTGWQRQTSGELKQAERRQPMPPKAFNGGGGLYSTCADYTRFMQAILNQGAGILRPASVETMRTNQIGSLTAGKMKSFHPELCADVDIQPGATEKWTLGFLLNTTPYPGGRSAGSLAWAGLYNTFYWIDPGRNLAAVLMMQFLPFVDQQATGLLNDFERAVYTAS